VIENKAEASGDLFGKLRKLTQAAHCSTSTADKTRCVRDSGNRLPAQTAF
jgi:hypothetical protein